MTQVQEAKKNALRISTIVTITGAVISYRVGAGFASGNEYIQIFGSWGPDVGWAVFGATLVLLLGAVGTYLIAYRLQFNGSDEAYRAIGGNRFGKFIQIFTGISLVLNLFTMFAGAGSLLNQFMGLPNWVGSLLVGVVSFISLLGGLKSLEKVLGSIGIVILVYLVVFGVMTLVTVPLNMENIYDAQRAVEAGEILQVNLFALPPFSWIPGLAEHNNAFINGVVYGAEATFSGFPFLIMLAKRCKTKKEAVACGLAGDIGYLFAVVEMVFKDDVTSRNSRIFQIIVTAIGIFLGGVLPFSELINVLMPIRGVVGILLIVLVFAALYRLRGKSAAKEDGKEEISAVGAEAAK